MKRPVAYDHNLRVVGKPARKRSEQGYLLFSVPRSFPSVRLPTDRQGSPPIRNPSHKHLSLSGKLHRIDQKPDRAAPVRFCSPGRPLDQTISNRAVKPLGIDIFIGEKPSQVARLALQLGSPGNSTSHLRKMNVLCQMLCRMQSSDHLEDQARLSASELLVDLGGGAALSGHRDHEQ